jgi:actin-related protein
LFVGSKGENVQEYIGADALHAYRAEQNEANAVQLLSPIQNGEIVDWDAMQVLFFFESD